MNKIILTKRFNDAFLLASNLHACQFRNETGIPYISHLLGATSIVLENGGDENEAIAALLHDSAEDQGGRDILQKIRCDFGEKVARIVEECTDTFEKPKPEWKERKLKYIERLPHASESGQLVSLADKLHNARAILFDYTSKGEKVWDRFTGKKSGTLWYYQELVDTFKTINNLNHQRLVNELAKTVEEIRKCSEIKT